MNKQRYIQEKADIALEINKLTERLKNLDFTYIMCNQRFNIDDRIKITSPARTAWSISKENIPVPETVKFAYVIYVSVGRRDEIEYKLVAEKKDGSRSLKSEYYSTRDILELA